MATANTDTVVARESFIGRIGTEDVLIRQGDLFRASDPAPKKWPDKFGAHRFTHDKVEQATAAPGEKR